MSQMGTKLSNPQTALDPELPIESPEVKRQVSELSSRSVRLLMDKPKP